MILYKIWEIEQNEVQLALNNITDDLESLKNLNANVEEAVYNRRCKYVYTKLMLKIIYFLIFLINRLAVESKLLAVLTKYDTEIGSRYRTLEELGQIYENDKLEKLALEVNLYSCGEINVCVTQNY